MNIPAKNKNEEEW